MERLLLSIKWSRNEKYPAGWEPVKFIRGKLIPSTGIDNWTFERIIEGRDNIVKNPDGIEIVINLTQMEVVNW